MLGVVILSDDFMLSKWPMIELEILTNSSAEVMPVFYKLLPPDVKSPKKEWKKEWKKMARQDRTIDIRGWEEAVKSLASQTGEIYKSEEGHDEGEYINRIVSAICTRCPPSVTYDVSYAKGQERFIKEVELRFENAVRSDTPTIIGMHGIGGLGKTTVCKVMANFYNAAYCGKSVVMEFPSYKEEGLIVKECKKVLKRLTHASEKLLEDVDCFDKAVQLMRERMKSNKVFLSMDNVWEHSYCEARRILDAGFGGGSKVLVTSRSEAHLEDLLNKARVTPLISMNEKEALETFQDSFEADLSFASRTSLDRVVRLCLFNGSYHPLALKALGRKLKNMGGDASAIDENLCRISLTLEGSNIDDLIKINYDVMSSIAQRMFLDVAVIFRRTRSFKHTYRATGTMGFEEMREWLIILYEGECGDDEIDNQIHHLALDGLLQFEHKGKNRKVVVHELYVDLAERKAAASSRILLGESANLKAVRWAKLERVVLDRKREEAVELQDCPKLQLLYASEQTFSQKGLQLKRAKALRLLKVTNCIGNLTELKAVSRLAALHLQAGSSNVEVQPAKATWAGSRAVQDVRSCGELKSLVLQGESIFSGTEDFCRLTDLRTLELGRWASLKKLPDLTASAHLEWLYLRQCESLEEIRGLPSKLKSIILYDCKSLQSIPDLGRCAQLQILHVKACSLERIPNLLRCAQLQSFYIRKCGSLEEIKGLPSNLERVVLKDCASLHKIPDLGGCAHLQSLDVQRCGSLKEIPGDLPSNLLRITLRDCPTLRIPDLGKCPQLQKRHIRRCPSLEDRA